MHALLVALMTLGIVAALAGFFTAVFGGLVAGRTRLALLGLAALTVALALAVTTGVAGGATPAAASTSPVSHLGYGKF